MTQPNVSQDDILDVMEMTHKLENYMHRMFKDNNRNISMSVLMSATINCVISQCETIQDVKFYKDLFFDIFDTTIKSIKIKDK